MSNLQFMTAAELVEETHRMKGEPTYRELEEINTEMLAALESIGMDENINLSEGVVMVSIQTMQTMQAAIAKAKGE